MKCYEFLGSIPTECFAGRVVVRVPGLIGDNILASTRFETILARHEAPLMILSTYPYAPTRLDLLDDLYRELLASGIVAEIVNSPYGNLLLDPADTKRFLDKGAVAYYDPIYRDFTSLMVAIPKLGPGIRSHWQKTRREPKSVALFRRSAFHSHVPERNRPQNEWQEVEDMLSNQDYEMALYGYDDDLANTHNVTDYRGKLSIYGTLKSVAGFERVISVATFLPVFCQFFIPCYVLVASSDVEAVKKLWRMRDNYHILDVSKDWIGQIRSAFVG